MTAQTTYTAAGYAARAVDHLDRAAGDGYATAETRTLDALQGIGYALLAISDQLADGNDAAADLGAHLEQLAMTVDAADLGSHLEQLTAAADEVADRQPHSRRGWSLPRRRREAGRD